MASSRRLQKNTAQTTSFRLANNHEVVDYGEVDDSLTKDVYALLGEKGGNDDMDISEELVEVALRGHYDKSMQPPTGAELERSVLEPPSPNLPFLEFKEGMWIEYYGEDMEYHLTKIRKVLAEESLSVPGKMEYFYNVGIGKVVPTYLTRAPEEGLIRLFGYRPTIFKQYALLRVAKIIRFQISHQRDFERFHYVKAVDRMFNIWLENPQNVEFKTLFTSHSAEVQKKVKDHVFAPFEALDRITKRNSPGQRWDFANANNLSIYTYLSTLGSGYLAAALVLLLQLFTPLILLASVLQRNTDRFNNTPIYFANYTFPETDWNKFCHNERVTQRNIEGMLVMFAVLFVYVFRSVPRVYQMFFEAAGEGNTTFGRLSSLRRSVYDRATDTFFMRLGFKIEIYMRTFYLAALNLLMLTVLFLTTSPIEIILNALAIEFLATFDVEVSKSRWWDSPGKRWLKAGCVLLRIRSSLKIESLASRRAFCHYFDIPEAEYEKSMGDLLPLSSYQHAYEDEQDPNYMSNVEYIWSLAGKIARKKRMREAQWQFSGIYDKNFFGYGDRFFHLFATDADNKGIFNQHFLKYCAWSRWERVLFLARVPSYKGGGYLATNLKTVQDDLRMNQDAPATSMLLMDAVNHAMHPFDVRREPLEVKYFNPKHDVETPKSRFYSLIIDTLTFRKLLKRVETSIMRKKYHQVPFLMFDGLLEWLNFVLNTLFPLIIFGFFILVGVCY